MAASSQPLTASVTSGAPLTHGELDTLIARLQHRYQRRIHAEVRVEAGFVGGVRVEIGDDVWTTSLRSEIEEIARSRVHSGEPSGPRSPSFGRARSAPEAGPDPSDASARSMRSMPLGKAVVAPAIPMRERYEFLQSSLWARCPPASTRLLLLLGAERGCGVTMLATNFAASLARNSSARVLLIDACVRSPQPSALRSQEPPPSDSAGVSLRRALTEEPVLREPEPGPSNLYVLPSGMPGALSLAAFHSRPLDELLQRARELFEHIVIDGPSLREHPESLLLSRKADGVILVVESERTRRQSALWAKQQIEMAGGTLLGVILNRRKYRVPAWLYKRV